MYSTNFEMALKFNIKSINLQYEYNNNVTLLIKNNTLWILIPMCMLIDS